MLGRPAMACPHRERRFARSWHWRDWRRNVVRTGGPGRQAFRRPLASPAPAFGAMEALLVSTAVVALGEIGDKTQLLALLLAARYPRPWPIVAGIFTATLANHALAGAVGGWVRSALSPEMLRWLLGLSFIAVAAWALKPDKLDGDVTPAGRTSVFAITTFAFFLAEMGDKTQVATVILAAKFTSLFAVVIGTTLGMLLANAPVVFAGRAMSARIPFDWIRGVAAALFAAIGVWVLVAGVPAG